MNEKEMIKCPVCEVKFIPRTFYPEEAIFSTPDGKKLSGFDGYISTSGIKPPEVVISAWKTYCPNCNYILSFVKEIVRKEKIFAQTVAGKEVKEKYNSYYYGFPYGDYSQHLKEISEKLKNEINCSLDEINMDIWENLYTINDNFKFLVRFYASLESYCDSKLGMGNERDMIAKIKKLNVPKEVELILLELNNVKDQIVQGDYELSKEDQQKINIILVKFVFYLITKHIRPLINQKVLDDGYEFIKLEDLEAEVKSYLSNYLYSTFNGSTQAKKEIRFFLDKFLKEQIQNQSN
ncbi:MAG: hypothetical protein ACFFA8_09900 [Promethearchaeota archaeon]